MRRSGSTSFFPEFHWGVVSARKSFQRNILVTHAGYRSGHSSNLLYWRQGDTISLDWAPGPEAKGFLLRAQAFASQERNDDCAREILPDRLAHALDEAGLRLGRGKLSLIATLVAFADRLKVGRSTGQDRRAAVDG